MATNQNLYQFSKKYQDKKLSPLKSIRAYCKSQCCIEDLKSWKECTFSSCLLWRYRLGLGNRSSKQKDSSRAIVSAKLEPPVSEKQEKLI
ncbi:MAG: hypothetical protein NT076_01265 [Candidatus Pacearchaeota archaeon]|nr:hypothetical protein [Candidatus Pacearchaeota archaeon]